MNKWLTTGIAALAAGWAFTSTASAEELTLKCAYPFWPGFAPVYLAQEGEQTFIVIGRKRHDASGAARNRHPA